MTTSIAELRDELRSLADEAREAGASAAQVLVVFQEVTAELAMPRPPNAPPLVPDVPDVPEGE
jgi:hypothetical protein